MWYAICAILFFFFNDTATTEIYTLSLHDALPIYRNPFTDAEVVFHDPTVTELKLQYMDESGAWQDAWDGANDKDRKSTRLNSSHLVISYAVFCLKKKTTEATTPACAMRGAVGNTT